MGRLPYTNFHDINLDWVLKQIKKAFTPDNPPPYPVKSVNGQTGNVTVTGDTIPIAPNNPEKVTDAIREKQDAPASPGAPGQVLGLGPNQTPVWINQSPGVTSYDDLTGKPSVNGVVLSGEMDGTDLGLIDAPSTPGTVGQVLTSDGQGGQNWGNLPDYSDVYAPIIRDTASGAPASFPDGMANMPLNIIADILPVQDLHGQDAPYPDGGGKNKLPVGETETINGVTFTVNSDGSVNVSGTATANAEYDIGRDLLTLPAGTYYASSHATTSNVTYTVYKVVSGTASVVSNGVGSFTLTEDTSIFVRLSVTNGNTASGTAFPMIESGSAETDYAPYSNICPISGHAGLTLYTSGADTSNPDVYPVAWGDVAGTVYGGTYNSKTGKLTVTHFLYTYDGTESFSKSGTALNGFYNNLRTNVLPHNWPKMADYTYISAITTEISSMFKMTKNGSTYRQNYGYSYLDSGMNFNCDPDIFGTTVTSFKAKLAEFYTNGTPLSVYVKIDTPVEYNLFSYDLESFYGDNNVWSDIGPVSVDYYADTKLFILKVIS